MTIKPLKILFVCTANAMRSATAHEIYNQDDRFEVLSAGTADFANVPLTRALLEWADTVVVMERGHRKTIRKKYPDVYASKTIVCLYIPDEYDFMQPELIGVLRGQFEAAYAKGLIKQA